MYDNQIGRFFVIDKFSEKYFSFNPYHYVMNNPIKYIDVNGDSVSLADMYIYDKVNGTNYQQKLVKDLELITGLILWVDPESGLLKFIPDEDGNPLISTTFIDNKIIQNGSETARNDLIGYIKGKGVTYVRTSQTVSTTIIGENEFWLGESQINSFILGTSYKLNDATLGWGMTALHEFRHTLAGGSNGDPNDKNDFVSTGPTVDRVNIYRSELDNNLVNKNNKPFGQRVHYNPISSFDKESLKFIYYQISKGKNIKKSAYVTF